MTSLTDTPMVITLPKEIWMLVSEQVNIPPHLPPSLNLALMYSFRLKRSFLN